MTDSIIKSKPGVKPVAHLCLCGESNPDMFYGKRKTCCKKCHVVDCQKYRKDYKQIAVTSKGGKCIVCGYNKCNAALDFHHVDPSTKDPDISKMRNWSAARKRSEIDKCVLLCANCHREVHAGLISL